MLSKYVCRSVRGDGETSHSDDDDDDGASSRPDGLPLYVSDQ